MKIFNAIDFKIAQKIFLMGVFTLLLSCGFHLRGAIKLSEQTVPIYIQANNNFALAQQIEKTLQLNNVPVSETRFNANTQITLLKEQKSRRLVSLDSQARAHEYGLSYQVHFLIQASEESTKGSVDNNSQAKKIQQTVVQKKPQIIRLTRNLIFESDAVLASTNQSELLYQEMQAEAARLILLKLQSYTHP